MKKNVLLMLTLCIVFFSCEKDNISSVSTVAYSFDSDSNSKLMFKDGEPLETMTSESRRYEVGKVLRVKAINETTIEIANFAPVDIESATILLTIEGQAKPIKLLKINKIRAHAVQEIKYPFMEGTTAFLDTNNNEVNLTQYKVTGIPISKVSFDFTGETELIKKLKSLAKLKWKIKYHDFDPSDDPNNNWKENIDAKDIRRFSGFIINMAYLIVSDNTMKAFADEPIYDNDGMLMTVDQKKAALQKMIDMPMMNCGVVVNVSGLGGGSTYGVANHVLHDYLTVDPSFITIHEMAHMVGFSHSSSMTYPSKENTGATVAAGRVYTQMLKNDEFPIKVSNYYYPSDLLK
ncbi:hypothetical protein [Flavobacterium sp. JAS]|uniref:hypothetical protein n=1 Tax=Flavobacterium sp. JAS TaxID=2897329 RepID=UPI001E42AABF|nr:hypothetical protein [Flavobacterium sp. JAS]MCD0468792.1 hypothetical protein [Flavobacterium sp. JAS]